LAKKNDILYIEDSAQSFGATAYGRPAGSFSDAAIFSFCQNKVITCFGEGGAVVTNNEDLKNQINYLRSHGRVEEIGANYFESTAENEYLYPGYNFRISTVQAAFGLSQLNNLEEQLSLRRANAKRYNENLSKFNDVTIPIVPDKFTHCYQMYSVQFKNRETREKVREHLLKNGVHVRVYFEPLHLKKYYVNKYGNKKLPVSEKLVDTILSLPMYAQLSIDQIDYISELIGSSLKDNISCEII
ncbi:MAG: glutamine-scyllo-inositol transaminase, partial [uncultured bacterium]